MYFVTICQTKISVKRSVQSRGDFNKQHGWMYCLVRCSFIRFCETVFLYKQSPWDIWLKTSKTHLWQYKERQGNWELFEALPSSRFKWKSTANSILKRQLFGWTVVNPSPAPQGYSHLELTGRRNYSTEIQLIHKISKGLWRQSSSKQSRKCAPKIQVSLNLMSCTLANISHFLKRAFHSILSLEDGDSTPWNLDNTSLIYLSEWRCIPEDVNIHQYRYWNL
jgi:hypothetical protein